MKTCSLALAALLTAALVSSGLAADGHGHMGKHPHPGIHGIIAKIEKTDLTLRVTDKAGDSKDVVVLTDANTAITLDGKKCKLDDLKPGLWLHVESYDPTVPTKILIAKTNIAKDPKAAPVAK